MLQTILKIALITMAVGCAGTSEVVVNPHDPHDVATAQLPRTLAMRSPTTAPGADHGVHSVGAAAPAHSVGSAAQAGPSSP
jgi:hypothetical protein